MASVFARAPSIDPSPAEAAPPGAREPGTRSRAGNAMGRTRSNVLDGAARSIVKYGSRRTTMADIAALGGVAKATVYNHFRTKPEVYAALAVAEVEALAAECASVLAAEGFAEALARAADRIGGHPVVRRLALDEPAMLAGLAMPSAAPGWQAARAAVCAGLDRAGRSSEAPTLDLVLRWLSSHLLWPGGQDELTLAAGLLAAGLPGPAPELEAAPPTDGPVETPPGHP
ncbi:MAG: TetR/AcrR family transcriptional regulator [Actinomycetota bacterium]|nr:TetR/AcrR family transcriptional regulator [Actinomycetota bacterium]